MICSIMLASKVSQGHGSRYVASYRVLGLSGDALLSIMPCLNSVVA